ncbi:MAG: hypothetical protein ABIJ97_00530, partial [Bacteroidota bacterium]
MKIINLFFWIVLIVCSRIILINSLYSQDLQSQSEQKAFSFQGFVEEKGQFKTFDNLLFQWQKDNVYAYFLPDRVVFITKEVIHEDNERSLDAKNKGDDNLAKKLSAITKGTRFDLLFENCQSEVNVSGENINKTQNDYYLAHCPNGILNVPSFNDIRYNDIYPGIDMVFHFDNGNFKYSFDIDAGADPSLISLQWDGIENIHINEEGQLQFNVGSFTFTDEKPVSTCDGIDVPTKYILDRNRVKFSLDSYDNTKSLKIDPVLTWASSLEYNGYGHWGELVANSTGNFYIVDWEWNPGSADMTNYFNDAGTSTLYSSDATNNDIVISRFSRNGDLLWVCRYGSTRDDDISGAVTIDDNNNLFIAGKTFSLGDLPLQTWTGAYNQAWNGTCTGTRGYIIKFQSNNTRQWATYIDNGANFEPFDIECGMNNDIYICGKSGSSLTCTGISIPYGSGYLGNYTTASSHNFILRFNSSGALTWSTWLPGGTAPNYYTGRASDITVSKINGDVFVGGDEIWGANYNFTTALITAGLTYMGQSDLFYLKFNSSNNAVPAYGKYLGGAGFDKINIGAANGDIELDGSGNLYMCGHTYSANFPLVNPGTCAYYDGTINDGSGIVGDVAPTQDGYLIKINSAGTRTLATFFGGTAYTSMKKLKKDSHSNMWICAEQSSTGLATVSHNDYYNQAFAGTNTNLMFSQLDNNDYMAWLTYFGYGGYMGHGGFDIYEPSNDSINLDVCGNFNTFSNSGSGYQWTTAATCTGAASFRQLLSSSAPFTISGTGTICAGSTTTWTATMGGGSWSSSNTGVFTVNSSTGLVTGTGGGTATLTYTLTISSCPFTATATITINPLPAAPTSVSATSTTICTGQSTTLSYIGGSGTTFTWHTGSCAGTSVGTGNNLSVSPTSTTTYYGGWSNGCGNSTCQSVTVTVTQLPTAPTGVSATSTTICSGQSTTLSYSGGSGTTFTWHTGSCAGTSVGTGNNLSVSPTSTTTYYGGWSNSCGTSTCQSVTITVNPLPTPPTSVSATSTTICSGQSTTLSYIGGSGTTFTWHTGSCAGTSVGTGNNLSVSPTSTTTYYGGWSNGCGTSTCLSVTITVNPLPTAPTSVSASSTTICSGQSTTLSYSGGTGTTFNWYSTSCGTGLVGTGNSLSVSPTSTTTYYGGWSNGCGTSTCQSVTITVNPLPTAPTSVSATSTTICSGQSTTLSYIGGSGTTFNWYTGSCGGTLIGTGNNFSVSPTLNTTYYGAWQNGCGTSSCQNVTINVTAYPANAGTITGPITVCQGDNGITYSIPAITGATSYVWTVPSGFTGSSSTNSITLNIGASAVSGDITVYGTNSCGDGVSATLPVVVSTASTDPTNISTPNTTICQGSSATLTVNGGSLGLGADWIWYENGCGSGSSIGNGSS